MYVSSAGYFRHLWPALSKLNEGDKIIFNGDENNKADFVLILSKILTENLVLVNTIMKDMPNQRSTYLMVTRRCDRS